MTVRYCVGLLLVAFPLSALDIAQKRASLEQNISGSSDGAKGYAGLNKALQEKKNALNAYYNSLQNEYSLLKKEDRSDEEITAIFQDRFKELSRLKNEIKTLEEEWKNLSISAGNQEDEGLWHQPDTTIGQLVIDYGSSDYIYLLPPEIAALKVHVSSQLSVPKALWNEMLELVLANYGIGIKQLNTFMRQLYSLRTNQSSIVTITDDRQELSLYSPDERLSFVLHPPGAELRRVYVFLEKFVPQEQMTMQIISSNIVLTGFVGQLQELLKVYDFVVQPKQLQEYRLVALQKAQSEEIAAILQTIFDGENVKTTTFSSPTAAKSPNFMMPQDTSSGFRVLVLKQPSQSLFLLGKPEQIDRAVEIINDIESKIGEVQDKIVFSYGCKHSEAEELADVLGQVYAKMISSPDAFAIKDSRGKRIDIREQNSSPRDPQNKLIVNPPRISPGEQNGKKRSFDKHENFIVDTKTNSIVMVVESYILPQLKDLLKKLDVPKKMVQIDVLLFEKRVSDNNSFGLNLLRLGDAASDDHKRSLAWNTSLSGGKKSKKSDGRGGGDKGILQFLISTHEHGIIPAYDIAYSFLLSQEDIQINANPSVTCVNQTPAKIAVVEQISINTGVVEIDTTKATRLKDSYSREEYGITIQITPTVHAKLDDDDSSDQKFIHLDTDVVFDTTKPSPDNRPDVIRRNIKNEVRVADGETVILGGLRRKNSHDNQDMIPFLGELPGVGRLFSTSSMSDSSTEMFIFITPRIIPDKSEEFRKMRQQSIMARPGDIPEFLQELVQAQSHEKHSLFEQSMKMLLGRGDQSPIAAKRS